MGREDQGSLWHGKEVTAGPLINNLVCAPELRNCRKGSTSVMSDSEYSSSNSGGDSNGSGWGKTPLQKDEVAIIQGKLEQWMGADVTKRKSIFKDIVDKNVWLYLILSNLGDFQRSQLHVIRSSVNQNTGRSHDWLHKIAGTITSKARV